MDEARDFMSEEERALERRARCATLFSLAAVAAVALALAVAAFVAVERERARETVAWQVRLGLVADSRALDVGRWVDARFAVLRGIAQNASVQLYMTNLELGAPAADAVERQYLRNLLDATAMREGFLAQGQTAVDANVAPTGESGLALLDAELRPLAATPGMPLPPPELLAAARESAAGRPGLMDMRIGANGKPVIGFAAPIYAIQGDPGVSPALGFAIGLKVVEEDFFDRLRQPGDTEPTAENLLVRETAGQIEYLSPLADGTPALKRRLAVDTPELAAAFAVRTPGGFGEWRDYRGTRVLATGRAVPQTPWTVLRKVDRDAALEASDRRLTVTYVVILALIAAVTAGAMALWRHGSSIRVSRLAIRHKLASDMFEGLLQFVRTITDSQPAQIVVSDAEGRITFANKPFADTWGIAVTATKGKPLADVMGPANARPIEAANRRVLVSGEPESQIVASEREGRALLWSIQHVPVAAAPRRPASALAVISDVTELDAARKRSEETLARLVAALVGLVDRRDPFSALQSARTAEVSAAIAAEMNLSEDEIATARQAGQLMNVGKIIVPRETLTRSGPLSDAERATLSHAFAESAAIVADIPFGGPVAETIRQIGERWDGGGPLGLAGEGILVTARVVAVANAFVAMVSPRAYRGALTFDDACRALVEHQEKAFDRHPVSALIHILDNRGGAARWAHFRDPAA